jgi:hypothetical protein
LFSGHLYQFAQCRKAVAKARKQEIAIFVLEIVEQINEQEAVPHDLPIPRGSPAANGGVPSAHGPRGAQARPVVLIVDRVAFATSRFDADHADGSPRD